jgi:hypothetical protein
MCSRPLSRPLIEPKGTARNALVVSRFFIALVAIMAEFVAVLVLEADLYPSARPVLVVIVSAIPFVFVSVHSPIAADCTAVPVMVCHATVLAGSIHLIAIALLRSPVASELDVLAALLLLPARLLRLLWTVLWLHRNSLRLSGIWTRVWVLGEAGK